MATPANKKTISDVAKPGNTPADATSRPVIVNRESFIKDPMVNDDSDAKDKTPESEVRASAGKKVIKPLEDTETTKESAPEPDAKTENTEEAAAEPVSDNAVVDAVLDQVSDTKQQVAQDKETEQRQVLVDKLVEQKKYFVPLATAQHRRNNKIAVVVVAALLPLLVGIVLAMDAGVIETGVTLPFDLIK